MADFSKAIPRILENEGGLTDDPDDPGGVTNYGIILDVLREEGVDVDGDGDIDREDILDLTPGMAKKVYRARWDRWRLGEISDDEIATKIFDLCVNTGFRQASKFVQRALLAIGLTVTVDGCMGKKTIAEVNVACASDALRPRLLNELRRQAADFYILIAERKPPLRKFLKGWLRRAAQ